MQVDLSFGEQFINWVFHSTQLRLKRKKGETPEETRTKIYDLGHSFNEFINSRVNSRIERYKRIICIHQNMLDEIYNLNEESDKEKLHQISRIIEKTKRALWSS